MYVKNGCNCLFTLKSENEMQHNKDDSGGSWNHLTKKEKFLTMTVDCTKIREILCKVGMRG